MKAQLTGNKSKDKYESGFATLEILIAFSVLILCISAVVMITFSNQFIAIDSKTSLEALSHAQSMLEKTRADSEQDFNSVNSSTLIETSENSEFTKRLNVLQTNLFTKEVTASVSWQLGGRNLSTILATLLTNREAANGGDTCSSVLVGDWKNPQIESTISFSSLPGIPASTYVLTNVDAYQAKLYVTASKTTSATDPTFFIFDINDPSHPLLLGKIDNASTVSTGLSAVAVANDYAYLANAYTGSTPSCTANNNCAQLQIVDISNAANPTLIKNIKVQESTSSGNLAAATDVLYSKDYLYLGLVKTASGLEFNIFDISDLSNPIKVGGYSVGNGVNSILIKNDFAYIASPNTKELQILDISDRHNPTLAGSFNSSSGGGNGKNIYLVGKKLYLGKTTGVGLDFHILDSTDPNNTLKALGGVDVGTGNSVNGVIVRDYLSFLLTNKDLKILNTENPAAITSWSTLALPGTYDSSKSEPSMDCEGNRIFISSNNEGQGSIYIIKPGE